MNIFYLDDDPVQAARAHVDKHVVKMPLEYAQLLSTAHFVLDGVQRGYKPTHVSHPSAVWTRESRINYLWLFDLFRATSDEYKYRYRRGHKSWEDLKDVLSTPPDNCPDVPSTPLKLAMPPEFFSVEGGTLDPVASYRNYYRVGKAQHHKWSFRSRPSWVDSSGI